MSVEPTDDAAVRECFERFARFGETGHASLVNGMTSRNFVKLAKDCGLIDRTITLTVLDIAFTKAKINAVGQAFDAASKKVNYAQFLLALEICAKEKGCDVHELYAKVAAHAHDAPVVNATIAEPNKFYDDKSTYTAALRGSHKPLSRGDSIMNLPTPTRPADDSALAAVFERFARFGETAGVGVGGMSNRNLVKMFKDCELVDDKTITPTFLDLAFAKAARAPVGSSTAGAVANRLTYPQFLVVCELCAQERGVNVAELHGAMVQHKELGPVISATVAEPNKFHDDKSTYTALLRGTHSPLSKGDPLKSLPTPVIPNDHARVSAVFERYCRFGETASTVPAQLGMTNRNLVKLFKDCELEDKVWSSTFLDLAFARAKNAPHGKDASDAAAKRLNYEQFLVCLELCALEKQLASSRQLHERIAAHALAGPTVNATVAEPNKFHDDKSTYTANLRGSHKPLSRADSVAKLPTPTKPADGEELASVFDRYMRFGETGNASTVTGMTNRNFVKLFKDAGLEDRRLTVTFLDLAFTRARAAPAGKDAYDAQSKRMSYDAFLVALELCAQERGCSAHQLHSAILAGIAESGPRLSATVAEPNKFHDDKSTYTALLRGTHSPLSKEDSLKKLPIPQPPHDERVERVFEAYARFGETAPSAALGLTSRNFVKLFKDCELVDKKITTTFLDLAFAKAKNAPGGITTMGVEKSNKISWTQFQVAVELCALELAKPSDALYLAIAGHEADGPLVTATVAQPNKFHDDKSTYTAVANNVHVGGTGTDSRRESLAKSLATTASNASSKSQSRKGSASADAIAAASKAATAGR
ncbi:hypothetical protein KFE25_013930 [Diacronema lutheri]|uniref:Uncharacterized protein n=1 Tax=Diacronema lutheri TaxID=2081491 RepID=A0A8J5XAL0_DIALT|nr:hypothetical protein KFE25_013930 [Diacronema lutheri]